MVKQTIALVSAVLLVFGSSSIALAETGVTDKEIVIGIPNALSGNNEYSGKQTSIGIRAYFQQVNASGGVNGRKIKAVTCDDRYEVDGAIQCFQKLEGEGVFSLCGFVGSALIAKYMTLCQNKKVPGVGCYSGPTFMADPPKRYLFAVRPGYQEEEKQFIDHLWKEVGAEKFAIIYQNDAYGADHLKGMQEALKKYGKQIVAAAAYERNTENLQSAFDTVREANPEAVSLAANNKQCLDLIRMANKANWHPIFFINSGANVDGFMQKAGSEANGVVVGEIVPSPSHSEISLVSKYLKALKQYFPDQIPCYTSLRGYVDALVTVEGIKRCGKDVTRDRFVDALDSIKKLDIGLDKGSEISFNPNDHFGVKRYIFGIIKNGEVQPIGNWKKALSIKK